MSRSPWIVCCALAALWGASACGQDEPEGGGRRRGPMFDAEGEVGVAPAQVEVGVAPGVQVPGAAQRLPAETGRGVLAQVVDDHDGESVVALERPQLTEQRGHVGGGVFVGAMQADEGIEEQ